MRVFKDQPAILSGLTPVGTPLSVVLKRIVPGVLKRCCSATWE